MAAGATATVRSHLRVVAQEGALLAAAICKPHIALLHQRLERTPGHISYSIGCSQAAANVRSTGCAFARHDRH